MPHSFKRLLGLCSLSLLGTGCVSVPPRYSFSPIPASHQSVKFADGIPFVFSRQTHLVSVSLPEDNGTLASEFSLIAVSVVNCGDRPFVIDGRNVQLSSDNRKLHIVPETQIQNRINSRAMWFRIANAFASAANATAASMPSTTTYTGSAYSGGQYASYSGVVTTYDPARAALASSAINQQQARTDQEIEQARRAQVDALASGFKRHTLSPSEAYLGGIYVENKYLRRAGSLRLSVNIGSESHTFEIRVDGPGSTPTSIDYAASSAPLDRWPVPAPTPTTSEATVPSSTTATSLQPPTTEKTAPGTTTPITGLFKNQRLTIETKDGRKFIHARLIEFTADYVIVSTADGVFTLRKGELPDDVAQWLPEAKPISPLEKHTVNPGPGEENAAASTDRKNGEEPTDHKSWWERIFD